MTEQAVEDFLAPRRVEFQNLLTSGYPAAIALMVLLYRAGAAGQSSTSPLTSAKAPTPSAAETDTEAAYTLAWPLLKHLAGRADLQERLIGMNSASAQLASTAHGIRRALAASDWPPLVESVESLRQQLLHLPDVASAWEWQLGELQLNPGWDAPSIADRLNRLELHRSASRLSGYPLPYPDWLRGQSILPGQAGEAVTAAAARLRGLARLGPRWQYGMEMFLLYGTSDGFWESFTLGPFLQVLAPGQAVSSRYPVVVSTMPGFRLTDVQDVDDDAVARQIQGAVFLLSGLAEPGWQNTSFRLLDLVRNVRLLQLRQRQVMQAGRPRAAWTHDQLLGWHVRDVVETLDRELEAAAAAGHLTRAQQVGLSLKGDPDDPEDVRDSDRELRRVLDDWKIALPDELDGSAL